MKLDVYEKYLLFFICFFGILLRYVNHSYDNLWYDEIISFWVANPDFPFQETLNQNRLIEDNSVTYNLILKYFFLVFGYSAENGRLISVVCGSCSILTVGYLCKILSKDRIYLFAIFLTSFNIYLISYSQEIRVYSMLFLFASLNLIFFFKIINKNSIILSLGFAFSSIILSSLHPFSLIIFLSYALYLGLIFLNHKKIYKYLSLIIFLIFIFAIFVYLNNFLLTTDTQEEYFWMSNPDLGFFSNYYFSNFFGSRLLGLIFLTVLIFLIFNHYKKKINLSHIDLFLIIIFLSYFLPIVFGYMFKPILTSRYIIFVLIPITLLISILINHLHIKKKFFLLSLLILLTIGNHFTEQTFKQFFENRMVSKPEYSKALKYINNSNDKLYFLKVTKMKNEQATINAINNYINYIIVQNNLDVKFVPLEDNNNPKIIWHICLQDISEKKCSINIKKPFNILAIKNFNSIELKLIKLL